jgi:L-cysteate sulfo-lyase
MLVLTDAPRVQLGHLPTPLEYLDRFSESLGGPRIWIKRDDCTGLATGGNKTRKLEFLLADAIAQSCDTVITYGAVQSNHARQTAAACARLGLDCHLVLSRLVDWHDDSYESAGNIQLDRLFNASIEFVDPAQAATIATSRMTKLKREGRRVYSIPPGGSNEVGALGYAVCAQEICQQAHALGFAPDLVIHASSSGGTHAGLAIGMTQTSARIVGINVSEPNEQLALERTKTLALATRDRFAAHAPIPRVELRHEFLGPAYGIPTPETIAAIRALARLEGIVTDPVYSGKALAALISMIEKRELDGGKNVVFVHTGGVGSLSAYLRAF